MDYRKLIEKKASKIIKADNASMGVGSGGDSPSAPAGPPPVGQTPAPKQEAKPTPPPAPPKPNMEFEYDGEMLHLDMDKKYSDGRQAILVLDQNEEPFAKLSTNINVTLEPGEFLIKNYSENEALAKAVFAKGWFEDTGKRVRSGYVRIPIWKIKTTTASTKKRK